MINFVTNEKSCKVFSASVDNVGIQTDFLKRTELIRSLI
jgi:hypothetical protein